MLSCFCFQSSITVEPIFLCVYINSYSERAICSEVEAIHFTLNTTRTVYKYVECSVCMYAVTYIRIRNCVIVCYLSFCADCVLLFTSVVFTFSMFIAIQWLDDIVWFLITTLDQNYNSEYTLQCGHELHKINLI